MRRTLAGLLWLAAAALTAQPYASGSRFFYIGAGGNILSGAGSGGTYSETVHSSLLNPAAMGGIELSRWAMSGGLFNSSAFYSSLSAAVPFNRGVISGNLLWGKPGIDDPLPDTGHSFLLQGNFAKQLTPRFSFGFGLRLLNAYPSPGHDFNFGGCFNIGILLRQNPLSRFSTLPEEGFKVYDFRFAFSATGLGWNLTRQGVRSWPDSQLRAAFSLQYYRAKWLSFSAANDTVFSLDTASFRNSTALHWTFFNVFKLSGGVILGLDGIGPFTWGASLIPKRVFGDSTLRIAYAFVPRDSGTTHEYTHTLSLELILGKRDKQPPRSTVTLNRRAFSPNNDGYKDSVTCRISIRDNRQLKQWQVQVLNSSNRVVRVLNSREDPDKKLRPGNFFKQLFATRDSVSVPQEWVWNGRNEQGKRCPDGKYRIVINAADNRGNRASSQPVKLLIRTAPPRGKVSVTPTLFSPNGDGNKDEVQITQQTAGTNTVWTGRIFDNNGKAILQFDWKENPPGRFNWNGKNRKGVTVPDGNYRYVLQGEDDAGNRTKIHTSSFTLSTLKKPLELQLDRERFSPNNDRLFDRIRLQPGIEEGKWFASWSVRITNRRGETVFIKHGSNSTPGPFYWNGQLQKKALPDGEYSSLLTAFYRDGDRPSSRPKKMVIDNTPPQLAVKIKPELFSPDGDGFNDQLSIFLTMKDSSAISNWRLTIYQETNIFKTFTGSKPSGKTIKLLWDGKGDNGTLVASATRYTARLEATDILGNKGSAAPVPINVDILIIKTSRGLKIRVSSIEFTFDKWELKQPNSPILNRVAELLKRYNTYKVIIEGHTDGVGRANYNLMLSTRRARTVMRYLIHRGIDEDRMLAKGLGASVPLASNRTLSGRAINRRVEFILVRD